MSVKNPPKISKKNTRHGVAKAVTHVPKITSTGHAIARGRARGGVAMMSAPDANAAAGGPDPWEPK